MPGVAHIPYLERRPSGFFFRRRIPTWLQEISNPDHGTNICLAMRTDVLSEAKTLARSLTALSDTAFALMSERPMNHLSAQDTKLLTELARFQIAAHEATLGMADPRSEAAANAAVEAKRASQDVLRHALATGNHETMRAPLKEVAERLGVCVAEDTTQWQALAYEALKVMLDVSRERERREAERYDGETILFKSVMASAHQSKPPQESVVSAGTCASTPAQICRVDEGSGASQAEYPAPAPLAGSMNSEQAVQTPISDAPTPRTVYQGPSRQSAAGFGDSAPAHSIAAGGQSGAILERRIQRERPSAQSPHTAIMGSNAKALRSSSHVIARPTFQMNFRKNREKYFGIVKLDQSYFRTTITARRISLSAAQCLETKNLNTIPFDRAKPTDSTVAPALAFRETRSSHHSRPDQAG